MFPNWGTPDPGTTIPKDATWPFPNDKPLNASQSFVFILGGKNGNEGFSIGNDPWNSPQKRKGPYFNFKPERLDLTTNPYTYKDYWNNDARLVVYSSQMVASGGTTARPDETPSDYPKRQTIKTNTLYMPKGYQIFSAGKDGLWGANGGLAGQYGQVLFNGLLTNNGEDDQCNFSESPLGKPIND